MCKDCFRNCKVFDFLFFSYTLNDPRHRQMNSCHPFDTQDKLLSIVESAENIDLCQMFEHLSLVQKKQALIHIIQNSQCAQRNTLWYVAAFQSR